MDIDKASLLGAFSDPTNFGISSGIPMEFTRLPDGTPATDGLSFARYVRRTLGSSARIVGYWCEDNPVAKRNSLAGGHDFIILDDRFLIDASLSMHPSLAQFSVLDMLDTEDNRAALNLFGDIGTWEFSEQIEHAVDDELADYRGAVMNGTRLLWIRGPEMDASAMIAG